MRIIVFFQSPDFFSFTIHLNIQTYPSIKVEQIVKTIFVAFNLSGAVFDDTISCESVRDLHDKIEDEKQKSVMKTQVTGNPDTIMPSSLGQYDGRSP